MLPSAVLPSAVLQHRAPSSLTDRLVRVRSDAGAGVDAALEVRSDDGPVAAVIAAGVEAGATVIVLDEALAADLDQVRDARRSADVAWALTVERGAR